MEVEANETGKNWLRRTCNESVILVPVIHQFEVNGMIEEEVGL